LLTVADIGLASHNATSAPVIPAAPLRFLATVDPARIPLYLAAGPSLDVWTTSAATEEWFASILSTATANAAQGWWAHAKAQSPIGFLVKVDEGEVKAHGSRITEILFYATISAAPTAPVVLPTPPSSSPDAPYDQSEQLPELTIHALPLSSDLLYQDALREIHPLFPALNTSDSRTDIQPQFLPPLQNPETTPVSPRRKRDLFDEASQARKKARAAAAAKGKESQHPYGHRRSMSTDTKPVDSRPNSAQGARPSSRPLSESPSLSFEARPLSRKGTTQEAHSKRSTLSQVATVPIHPEEPTVETRNKEALSRVVMTAMRMHGLQQRKKTRSRRGSLAPGGPDQEQVSEGTAAEEAVKDEEYKLIYHQTYKGAVLALVSLSI
jgi:hypothetical protein